MFIQFLKTQAQRPLLLFIFVTFSLILFLYRAPGVYEQIKFQNSSKQKQETVKTAQGLPIRLIIPKINVDALIEYMGVTAIGAMDVPNTAVNVGWFKLGPQPGERGSAVIAGHFDGKNGEAGVFINLYRLKQGDKIYVENNKKTSIAFVVREIRIYDPGYANSVFSTSESAHLNLITCDGAWDGAKKSYDKRLVVFADILR